VFVMEMTVVFSTHVEGSKGVSMSDMGMRAFLTSGDEDHCKVERH
jgi:hypothetical protein